MIQLRLLSTQKTEELSFSTVQRNIAIYTAARQCSVLAPFRQSSTSYKDGLADELVVSRDEGVVGREGSRAALPVHQKGLHLSVHYVLLHLRIAQCERVPMYWSSVAQLQGEFCRHCSVRSCKAYFCDVV